MISSLLRNINSTIRECKPGGYFSNPGLRVWQPSNPGTRVPGFDVGPW